MDVIEGNSALLTTYYGHPPKQTMRALVAVEDGRPIGVAGIKIEGGKSVLFSDFSDELREHSGFKRAIIKGYRRLLQLFPDTTIYSKADPDIEGACDLLAHLGFRHYRGDLWIL